MVKLYVNLQTPTIELTIETRDAAGTKDKVIVGFSRYPSDEAKEFLEELGEIYSENVADDEVNKAPVREYIKKHIQYLKDANIKYKKDDSNKLHLLKIADTRKEISREGFWSDSDECLNNLVELYLSADCWFYPFYTNLTKSLGNFYISEDDMKLALNEAAKEQDLKN